MVCEDFEGASLIPKKGNLVNSNHFLEREKSGNIEKRKRKTKGVCEDDDTEVC